MTSFQNGLTPKLRPLAPRRTSVMSVLDVGTNKIVCLIARLRPLEGADLLPGRSHQAQILGIGHQRSRGLKSGAVVDMEAAEQSIRHAVDAAERMAGVRVDSVIVNVSCGRIGSEHYSATVQVGGHQVGDNDIHRVLDAGANHSVRDSRAVLHSLPIGHMLDVRAVVAHEDHQQGRLASKICQFDHLAGWIRERKVRRRGAQGEHGARGQNHDGLSVSL